MRVPEKIERAAQATAVIDEHVAKARSALSDGFEGRIVNGFGVFADVSRCSSNLREAIQALQSAKAQLDATVWPRMADYTE